MENVSQLSSLQLTLDKGKRCSISFIVSPKAVLRKSKVIEMTKCGFQKWFELAMFCNKNTKHNCTAT